MNMIASFIIPAYNASNTINRCLDSIYSLALPDQDYEIIIIDDDSSDDTVDIVKNHIGSHDNITLLCQPENHRQGAARNRGIALAQGEYIVFVDSDDVVSKGVVTAIRQMVALNLEMVAMSTGLVDATGDVQIDKRLDYDAESVFSGIDLQTKYPFWNTPPWPYIYRKSFLTRVNYPFAEDVLFEDTDFVSKHLYHAKRMAYCDECGYLAYYNESSTTHTISYKHVSDYALLGCRMLSIYQSIEPKNTKYSDSILEGGSHNIMQACKNLFKLKSISDVQSFYARFDSFFDRKQLLDYREPPYCWTRWTRFCLKHKKLTVLFVGCILSIRNIRFPHALSFI